MKFLCKCFGTCALAAAMAAALAPAMAQTAATAVTTAASAPLAPKAGPRRMTPAESRDSATMPGDLRPEERVTPQLVIPLRKGAAQPKPATAAARRAAAPASAGIDDTAARCEAESSKQARQRCREAHAMPTRPR